ncbi:DUF1653 domain-containing protein [Microbacterium sp. P01]|uniref:DUF1653 domain-containing protein n=1 Tax=unclassified Microbacterium TaxID=2609290 RepID=UPI00366AF9AC
MDTIDAGTYRHFKGELYDVIGTARHSETEEVHVVYRPRYDPASLWIRPAKMWVETVEHEGHLGPRFTRIE